MPVTRTSSQKSTFLAQSTLNGGALWLNATAFRRISQCLFTATLGRYKPVLRYVLQGMRMCESCKVDLLSGKQKAGLDAAEKIRVK
jgi:hypothetical protein